MRKYDVGLVKKIREKQNIISVDGLNVTLKPVPDDERENVLDPRVLEIARNKKKMFGERAKQGFRLSNERFRPDKVTYDLSTREILCDERLIKIKDSHMIDVYIYRPANAEGILPVMVYFHGGGWTAGDMRLYANQMKYVSDLGNCVCVFPEYRLAPECPYPGPVDDCIGTIEWVVQHADELKVDPERLMVAGDSAGGGLLNSCLCADEKGLIKKAFEIYPGVDLSDYKKSEFYEWSYDKYPVIDEHRDFAYSRIERIKAGSDGDAEKSLYLQGKTTSDDPMVSIVYADEEVLKRFPPTVIVASEYDFLRIGEEYLAKRLSDLGVDVRAIRYLGCDHGFFDLLGTTVQAEELCYVLAEELNKIK